MMGRPPRAEHPPSLAAPPHAGANARKCRPLSYNGCVAERVASCWHSRDVIELVMSLVDERVMCSGGAHEAAIGRALNELDDLDRAALIAALPAIARLADVVINKG